MTHFGHLQVLFSFFVALVTHPAHQTFYFSHAVGFRETAVIVKDDLCSAWCCDFPILILLIESIMSQCKLKKKKKCDAGKKKFMRQSFSSATRGGNWTSHCCSPAYFWGQVTHRCRITWFFRNKKNQKCAINKKQKAVGLGLRTTDSKAVGKHWIFIR